jgi:hypothetical protein
MAFNHLTEESKMKLAEFQWQDHFQTRVQTWKTLEIAAILSVALIGIDWRIDDIAAKYIAAILLFIISAFGSQITIRHRNVVERNKFGIMKEIAQSLDINDPRFEVPEEISWWSIFDVRKKNIPLFVLRIHFVIQIFAICYLILAIA